ncbi:hypothetical protein K504DRAFT_462731 [Pleomassaria siparia CBS 279.74]|uniref:EthD domain-containing protein n=1 Tax=Pleomassaria siparia CBS 279.74 TaxID=1314801 RepID=A0A6G1JV96_9PLEO|nr:hypothetical protein K504DRAFT_462731 [Pleomassaria siparia CBS 279.74]
MASIEPQVGCINILSYIKRNPVLTRDAFYEHWELIHGPKVGPWVEEHGFKRYQQIYVSGATVPIPVGSTVPPPSNSSTSPALVEYDGIALFTVSSMEKFVNATADPYYSNVIGKDQAEILDMVTVPNGVVQMVYGTVVEYEAGKRVVAC